MIKTKINPLVSIILRTKNEERWITKCLKKIFEQSYKNFEIIIVDNHSTDNTLKRAQKYNIKSIIKIDKFYPGKAINLGISKSKGDLLVILSSHCIPVNNKWLSFLVSTILVCLGFLFLGCIARRSSSILSSLSLSLEYCLSSILTTVTSQN